MYHDLSKRLRCFKSEDCLFHKSRCIAKSFLLQNSAHAQQCTGSNKIHVNSSVFSIAGKVAIREVSRSTQTVLISFVLVLWELLIKLVVSFVSLYLV